MFNTAELPVTPSSPRQIENDSILQPASLQLSHSSATVASLIGDDSELNPDDHFDVKAALISVANKWKHIGNALGISLHDLDAIEKSFGTDQSEALSQVISKWLTQSYKVERFGKPSWGRLVKAVAHEAGGSDRHKALEIAQRHAYGRMESASVTSSAQSTPTTTSGYEHRCERPPKNNTALISLAINETKMLGDHASYHLSIPGEEAIRRLKSSGMECCYLTRYSEAQRSYVLSVYLRQRPKDVEKHFKIVIRETGRKKIDGHDIYFDTITELLEHYEKNMIHPSLKTIGQSYTEEEYKQSWQQQLRADMPPPQASMHPAGLGHGNGRLNFPPEDMPPIAGPVAELPTAQKQSSSTQTEPAAALTEPPAAELTDPPVAALTNPPTAGQPTHAQNSESVVTVENTHRTRKWCVII